MMSRHFRLTLSTMGKNRKGRRRGDSDSEEGEDQQQADSALSSSPSSKNKNLDFKQRRELQRKEAADKRRSKQKCHLCGKAGHVRRDCPGIEDDGRGESKYKSAKGDVGAKFKKGKKSGGQSKRATESQDSLMLLELPPGFEPVHNNEVVDADNPDDLVSKEVDDSFLFIDAGTDGAAAIQHLQTRVGDTKQEAIQAYQSATLRAKAKSNYGGCIAQHYMKTNSQPWDEAVRLPSPWALAANNSERDDDDESEEEKVRLQEQLQQSWFVVGLNPGWNCLEDDAEALSFLLRTIAHTKVVGLCATLDYTKLQDRQLHLTRAWCTCKAAMRSNLPIQLQLLPSYKEESDKEDQESPYSVLMADLEGLLDKIVETNGVTTQVHLSQWSGDSDTMAALLHRDNVWIGMDGTITFQKAAHAHACAFDVPLDRLLLETGTTIPSQVASMMGKDAFVHGGWIPFLAESVAHYKTSESVSISAEAVARAASANTKTVYRLSQTDECNAITHGI
jgi:Tat protein secretion system quality control protein TatD with DNase activity